MSLCHKLKFSNPFILQTDGVILWYFKLRLVNLTEFIVWNILGIQHVLGLGFPSNETFRRKFLFTFRKLFREILHFFHKNEGSEKCEIFFGKCENIFEKKISAKTIIVVAATINCAKKTCGILCYESSTYEIWSYRINNFFSFTSMNVWWRKFYFSSNLSVSVRPRTFTPMQVEMSQQITRKNL